MDTNRYGDMLKDVLAGVQGVDPVKVDTLQRVFNEFSQRENIYKSWLGADGAATFNQVRGQVADFIISPSRSVVFTETTNTTIAHDTYTQIDLIGVRGMLGQNTPETRGCVKWVEGYTNRWAKQDFVLPLYPILFFGDFGFELNGTGTREIYIEFFNKENVSQGGYTFSFKAVAGDWSNFSFVFMDKFDDGEYCKFWAWQDSGTSLSITSANFGFMMG